MNHNYPQLLLYLSGRMNEMRMRIECGENAIDELICIGLEKIRLTQIMKGEINDD